MELRSLVAAIDQGTTSSRCILFDRSGSIRATPSTRARPDHAAARLGRARPRRDPRSGPDVPAGVAQCHRRGRAVARRGRDQQPARDDRGVGSPDRPAGRARHRVAGHPDRGSLRGAGGGRGGRRGPVPGTTGLPISTYSLGAQARVDPRRGRHGTASCRGPWRPALRDHRYVAHLAPDRRARRRPARDRCHERLAHDADGPRDTRLGPGAARDHRRAGRDAPRDPRLVRGLRNGRRRPRGRADRRRPRRPARGALRPGLLRARADQVHLRDRLFHAHAHRRAAGPLDTRPHHDRGREDRRRPGHVCTRRLGRGRGRAHRLAPGQPRHHRRPRGRRAAGPFGPRQRRRRVRARVLRPVRAALAERRAGHHRRADALRDARPHRAGRARSRSRTRSSTSTPRWPPTWARHSPANCGWTAA